MMNNNDTKFFVDSMSIIILKAWNEISTKLKENGIQFT